MLYDRLWEISNWPLTVAYAALAAGALMGAALLIWYTYQLSKRMRAIETLIRRIEKKIRILEMQESRRLMSVVKELKERSRAKFDSRDTPVKMGGNDAGELTVSPPTAPEKPESEKSVKIPRQ